MRAGNFSPGPHVKRISKPTVNALLDPIPVPAGTPRSSISMPRSMPSSSGFTYQRMLNVDALATSSVRDI